MEKRQSPTMQEWQALYQAAEEFKQAKPWQWLWDADLICVKNPENGMVGYCSVMGGGGEHYALGVYLGDAGLYRFDVLMREEGSIPSNEIIHMQDCIMCSFNDREFVQKEDMKIIKELGLKFRGRNNWPVFRRFEPGYYPWYITNEECRFLTIALQQSIFVAHGIKDGSIIADFENGISVLRSNNNITNEWISEETEINVLVANYNPVKINNDILIGKINKLPRNKGKSLEVEATYSPMPVRERGERPIFPRLFVVADRKDGFILDFEMYEDERNDADKVLNKLINIFMKDGVPGNIFVRNERLSAILGDLCKLTGIKLNVKKSLPMIEEFIDSMGSRMLDDDE
jgi:hypothetical protein